MDIKFIQDIKNKIKDYMYNLKRKKDILSLQALITSQKGVFEFSNGKFYCPCGFYVPGISDRNKESKIYPNGKWYEEGSVLDMWYKKYGYLTDISVYYRSYGLAEILYSF